MTKIGAVIPLETETTQPAAEQRAAVKESQGSYPYILTVYPRACQGRSAVISSVAMTRAELEELQTRINDLLGRGTN